MNFRRIKSHLRRSGESYLIAFEIFHFGMDLILVMHVLLTLMG